MYEIWGILTQVFSAQNVDNTMSETEFLNPYKIKQIIGGCYCATWVADSLQHLEKWGQAAAVNYIRPVAFSISQSVGSI